VPVEETAIAVSVSESTVVGLLGSMDNLNSDKSASSNVSNCAFNQ
jgi:hypothetical protein